METKPNSWVKTILTALFIFLVPVLLWGGNHFIQNIRIRSAIRACEREMIPSKELDEPPDFPADRVRVLRAAGCRALPPILDALSESKDETFKTGCVDVLFRLVGKARSDKSGTVRGMELCGAVYNLGDFRMPEDHQRGLVDAREWWRTHAAECHPWWKPWPWKCLGD
jgi:hypothetical protein